MIDEISRIIASPIPCRQAFRLLSRIVGGGLLASLGLGRASRGLAAQVTCSSGTRLCGTECCPNDLLCCGGICYGVVTSQSYMCCGSSALCEKILQQCCTDHCCNNTHTCCGQFCCPPSRQCCNGTCCTAGAVCCGATCCSAGRACCNGICCPAGASCCADACCPKGHFCCDNKCVATRPSSSTGCTPV